MRRHKGTTKCPKQKTTQAQKTPTTPTAATTATSTGALHPICGTAPVMWRCTRYVALHPLCGGAPEQKRCIAYGSGAVPQHTRTNAELAHRTTHRHTPPCAPGPYWRQDGHAAHATTCTPAHSDTSHTLTCEEPDYPWCHAPQLLQDCPARRWLNALARRLQSKAIQARERAQIRMIKGGIRRVVVFQMDGVGISIIERPQPLHNRDTPNPAQHLLHPHMRRAGDVPAWVLRRPLSVRGWATSASLRSIGGPPPVHRQRASPPAGRQSLGGPPPGRQ